MHIDGGKLSILDEDLLWPGAAMRTSHMLHLRREKAAASERWLLNKLL
jgi:hypothetical protein